MDEFGIDCSNQTPLSEAEEALLWQQFVKTKDDDVRERLVENYLPLVYQTAERMSRNFPQHIDVQDLMSSGNLGLLDAIRMFNPDECVKFSTYASRRIYGAILDELRRLDFMSRQARQKLNEVNRAKKDFEQMHGRPAYNSELAEHMGMDSEEFDLLMQDAQNKSMISLDRKWDENDDNELGPIEMIPDTRTPDPLSELARAEIKEVAMKGLSDDEKKVLVLYYYENLNLKEIGKVLDLSESRVCQIHQKTLEFLKQKFIQRQITPYAF